MTIPDPKIFDQLLFFVKLYQHAKNKAVSLIYSGEIVDLKILQSDWLREFWPIYLEQNLSEIYDLNSANDISLHYRTTLVEMNYQIFL